MTVAIIDGDVMAYMACKPRWQEKADIRDGIVYVHLDSDGEKIPIEYTEEEDNRYFQKSYDHFMRDLHDLLEELFADEYMMAVQGCDNYRKDIYDEYKMHRHKKPNELSHIVRRLREKAVEDGIAIFSHGREADDYVRIWAEECRKAGVDFVICTVDKDLKCIPGKFYDLKKKTLEVISEEDAMRHYYEQLLKGDSTDNIPGLPKIGEKRAATILKHCKNEEEYRTAVVKQYKTTFQEFWEDYLLSNGKMIHIQRHLEDYFTLEEWEVG